MAFTVSMKIHEDLSGGGDRAKSCSVWLPLGVTEQEKWERRKLRLSKALDLAGQLLIAVL